MICKRIAVLVFCTLLSACSDPQPQPEPTPEPPPVEEPAPEPEPEPEPPPTGALPSDYVAIAFANDIHLNPDSGSGMTRKLSISWNQSVVDVRYVIENCTFALADGAEPLFHMTMPEAQSFAAFGEQLNARGRGHWTRQLSKQNRRAKPSHAEYNPAFETQTEAKKRKGSLRLGDEGFSEYMELLNDQLRQAQLLRDALSGQPGVGVRYDSIQGWCQEQ